MTGALCVIPARGGSVRVPGKNVRPLAGVPILARTIRTVREAGIVDRIVVSTDDDGIASVAREAGADVPFRRPAHLADERTPTFPVVADALERLAVDGPLPPTTWVVYSTAALLEPGDLVAARDLLESSGAPVVMAVVEARGRIERAWRRDGRGRGAMVDPAHVETRSQDLPAAWFDAGQFYGATTDFWRSGATLADVEPVLAPVPAARAVDIDTEDDWQLAEALFAVSGRT